MLYLLSLFIISANAAFDQEIHSKYLTMPQDEFLEYFNSLNHTWKVKMYNKEEQHRGHCSFIGEKSIFPDFRHDLSSLDIPDTFDARDKWPQCVSIGKIYDQQHCGSCWAIATASTASDRICIHENLQINLSMQDLGCCPNCFERSFCTGGDPVPAFQFWIDKGLVPYDCLPYDSEELLNNTLCTKTCVDSEDYNSSKNYGGRVYTVSSEEDQIKAELSQNGPIEVNFNAFDDLYDFHKGVYVHTYGDEPGPHSARLIGYGEENGLDYWMIANSWGTDMGDKGFYKIKRYQPELEFEKNLLAAMPKGY